MVQERLEPDQLNAARLQCTNGKLHLVQASEYPLFEKPAVIGKVIWINQGVGRLYVTVDAHNPELIFRGSDYVIEEHYCPKRFITQFFVVQHPRAA
jgi:hypothetical protein